MAKQSKVTAKPSIACDYGDAPFPHEIMLMEVIFVLLISYFFLVIL